jgi:hypothetical protein
MIGNTGRQLSIAQSTIHTCPSEAGTIASPDHTRMLRRREGMDDQFTRAANRERDSDRNPAKNIQLLFCGAGFHAAPGSSHAVFRFANPTHDASPVLKASIVETTCPGRTFENDSSGCVVLHDVARVQPSS